MLHYVQHDNVVKAQTVRPKPVPITIGSNGKAFAWAGLRAESKTWTKSGTIGTEALLQTWLSDTFVKCLLKSLLNTVKRYNRIFPSAKLASSKNLMMIKSQKRLSRFTLGALLTGCLSAYAQKLPNVQQGSLRAPAQIKIDGKTTEWNNQLQAYNKATGIYYTLCNDNNSLYLTIQAKDALIIRKVLIGGVVFSVNRSVNKNNDQLSITFPLLATNLSNGIVNYWDQRAGLADKQGNIYQRDSLLLLMNTTLINGLKEIKVKGVKPFADTIFSVYNNAGIQARMLFDADNALTCELAIPIKYFNLQPESATAGVSYQLKVNDISANFNLNTRELKPVMVTTIPLRVTESMRSRLEAEQRILNNATDFWGEYTMAK